MKLGVGNAEAGGGDDITEFDNLQLDLIGKKFEHLTWRWVPLRRKVHKIVVLDQTSGLRM